MGIDAVMGRDWPSAHASASVVLDMNQRAAERFEAALSWTSPPTAIEEFSPERRTFELDLGDADELDLEQLTILVVDDDSGIRDALTDILDQLGYSVVAASNGAEALDLLRAGCQPSAVLLDLGMPLMDGREFRHELLRDPRFCQLPVIVITASPNQRPEELHVTDVLTKPVQLSRLLDILESHVANAQPF
jgi:CheY-like chemotaxis protein